MSDAGHGDVCLVESQSEHRGRQEEGDEQVFRDMFMIKKTHRHPHPRHPP